MISDRRASNFKTDDYDGDIDTGRVDTMITSITCTDRKKFGLGAVVPFTTTRNLRTEYNSLMQSGRMPSLTHPEGKNLKEPKSPSTSGSRQTRPQNSID